MTDKSQLITIIIPFLNEEENLPDLLDDLINQLSKSQKLGKYISKTYLNIKQI